MRIVLCSIDEPLAKAWESYCGDLDGVEVQRGNILNQKVDAVVSPANSFSFMDGVGSVVFSGLGTGVGRVPPEKCGAQVRTAIKEVVFDEYEFPSSWADAQMKHQQLYTDKFRDVQF